VGSLSYSICLEHHYDSHKPNDDYQSKSKAGTRDNIKKSKSKAKHGFVILLYFLAALALGYGLYSEYWLAGESLMESIGVGGILLIIAGGLDQDFGTYLWIRDIFSNRQKKRQ